MPEKWKLEWKSLRQAFKDGARDYPGLFHAHLWCHEGDTPFLRDFGWENIFENMPNKESFSNCENVIESGQKGFPQVKSDRHFAYFGNPEGLTTFKTLAETARILSLSPPKSLQSLKGISLEDWPDYMCHFSWQHNQHNVRSQRFRLIVFSEAPDRIGFMDHKSYEINEPAILKTFEYFPHQHFTALQPDVFNASVFTIDYLIYLIDQHIDTTSTTHQIQVQPQEQSTIEPTESHPQPGPEPEPPLTPLGEVERKVYELIRDKGPISGKAIIHHLGISQISNLTSKYIPELRKRHPIKNTRKAGYYIEKIEEL